MPGFGFVVSGAAASFRGAEYSRRNKNECRHGERASMSRFVSRVAAAVIGAAAAILVACGASIAADYPTRTVTLVVPYPPGGGVDAMARVVAAKLSDALKQQFIVDN